MYQAPPTIITFAATTSTTAYLESTATIVNGVAFRAYRIAYVMLAINRVKPLTGQVYLRLRSNATSLVAADLAISPYRPGDKIVHPPPGVQLPVGEGIQILHWSNMPANTLNIVVGYYVDSVT